MTIDIRSMLFTALGEPEMNKELDSGRWIVDNIAQHFSEEKRLSGQLNERIADNFKNNEIAADRYVLNSVELFW